MKFIWLYPNAKINLGLKIVSRREDGFHNIDGFFMPVDWKDIIEIGINFEESNQMNLICSGIDLPGAPDDNILFKCYDKLRVHCDELPSLQVHLHKNIPVGAGLGGGSADAAFFIKGLVEACDIEISDGSLRDLLLEIGSDCPFFVQNKISRVGGIGDVIEPLPGKIDFDFNYILLVYPDIHVSTQDAYGGCQPSGETYDDFVLTSELSHSEYLNNDFEKTVFRLYPEVEEVKNKLHANGAVYASMSGSGSTVYGFFKDLPEIDFPDRYLTRLVRV